MTDYYYLAGPMSGIPQFNFPLFNERVKVLREHGMKILNPVELDLPTESEKAYASEDGSGLTDPEWGDFLGRDLHILATQCRGIILLPAWHTSKGARVEATVAVNLGLEVMKHYMEPRIHRWVLEDQDPHWVMQRVASGSVIEYMRRKEE